ncbi:hypothetical protein [Streptomyces sp. NRRL F-5650]|uniref:hypothetical protein n=1 Tax=Streptomyces sp. NRRL F-5650 TaxID=1463868 RepID=UPI0004C8C3F1|nr:hypothetical protein [Streptomyces sp. NRRL F-5650]
MFGRLAPPELNVLLLRDTDLAARGIRQALVEATPEERPGLERAAALVEQAAAASDAELLARWVHERLAAAGHEGPVDSVHAVKALRATTPGLSLRQAVRLTKDAAAHGP